MASRTHPAPDGAVLVHSPQGSCRPCMRSGLAVVAFALLAPLPTMGGADIVQILKLALAVTTKETTLRHQFRTHAIFNNTDKMTAMRPLGDDL